MHEIITLQLGPQANWLGSHYWNAQESYFTYDDAEESVVDHDKSFRQGKGADGSDTYTPRAIIYDFKQNFGALRRINELYEVLDDQADGLTWAGNTSTHRQPSVAPSPYQHALSQGEEPSVPSLETVRYWSDYSRTFYHPRSLVQIYDTELPPADRAFTSWNSGIELYEQLSKDDDLVERDLRPFAEECDQMQGLQVMMESDSAWAAFGSKHLEAIRDEYGKVPIWVFGLGSTQGREAEISTPLSRLANLARTAHYILQQATMYIPIATPSMSKLPDYISLHPYHAWHTSALQCTALESSLLPTRLGDSAAGPSTTLDHLAMSLTETEDRRIARLSATINDTKRKVELTNGHSGADTDARAPQSARNAGDRAKKQECDFFPEDQTPAQSGTSTSRHGDHDFAAMHLHRGHNEEEQDAMDLDEGQGTRTQSLYTALRMPLPSSFPRIYSLREQYASECSVSTTLRTSSSIADWVRSLERSSSRLVGIDEREEMRDGLRNTAEQYVWGFESDEDGDDRDDGDEWD